MIFILFQRVLSLLNERSNFDGKRQFWLRDCRRPSKIGRKIPAYGGMLIARAFLMAMKKLDCNRNFDQNWAWPKKTWFRERLNEVRAREEKSHRRATNTRKDATAIEAKPRGEQGSEEG